MKKEISYGEKYDRLAQITEQAEADRYFEECVQHTMSFGKTREEAEQIERSNIGYWSGYLNRTTQERVFALFKTEHPIFGKTEPSNTQALVAGFQFAALGKGLHVEDMQRLAAFGCRKCGGKIDHEHSFFFHSACHPLSAVVEASYKNGLVTISCGVCKKLVCEIAVASKEP